MVYNNLAVILRSIMIQAGFLGFLLGFGLSFYSGDLSLSWAILKGSVLALAFTWAAQKLLLTLFRYYLIQYELRDSN